MSRRYRAIKSGVRKPLDLYMTEIGHSSLQLYFCNYQRTRAFQFEAASRRAEHAENSEKLRVRWDVAEVRKKGGFQVDGDGAGGSVLFVLAVTAVRAGRRVVTFTDAESGAARGDSRGKRGVGVAGAAGADGAGGGARDRAAAAADVSVRLGGVCAGVSGVCEGAAGEGEGAGVGGEVGCLLNTRYGSTVLESQRSPKRKRIIIVPRMGLTYETSPNGCDFRKKGTQTKEGHY